MGTNYYLFKNYCKCCGRYNKAHIGKKSSGWKFLFATDLGYSKDSVLKVLRQNKGYIYDEYNEKVDYKDLLITMKNKKEYQIHNYPGFHYQDSKGNDFGSEDFS